MQHLDVLPQISIINEQKILCFQLCLQLNAQHNDESNMAKNTFVVNPATTDHFLSRLCSSTNTQHHPGKVTGHKDKFMVIIYVTIGTVESIRWKRHLTVKKSNPWPQQLLSYASLVASVNPSVAIGKVENSTKHLSFHSLLKAPLKALLEFSMPNQYSHGLI